MRWLLRLLVERGRSPERSTAIWPSCYELRRRRDGAAAADRWLRRQRRLYPWICSSTACVRVLHGWTDDAASLARRPLHASAAWPPSRPLSATIMLTVGVGLGATAAMVARPGGARRSAAVRRSGALVWIYTDSPPYRFRFSVVDYRALEQRPSDLQRRRGVSAPAGDGERDGDVAERVTAKAVTGSYFPLLRQQAALGRLFDPSDDARGEPDRRC